MVISGKNFALLLQFAAIFKFTVGGAFKKPSIITSMIQSDLSWGDIQLNHRKSTKHPP